MATRNRTLKVLNVAGNPSIAENISKILSNNEGLIERESHCNKVYDFNYTIQRDHCEMTFTSVTGPLTETCFQNDDRPWNSFDPLDLFDAPIIKRVPQENLHIIRTLEEEARKCQRLVLWFDDDREGENIAFQVAEVCKRVNYVLVRRAHFSSLIDRLLKTFISGVSLAILVQRLIALQEVMTYVWSLVYEQKDHPEWGPYAQRLLDHSSELWRDPSGGGHADMAHPPLYPIKCSSGESGWSEDHKMLYELVVRHYLACVSQPAVEAVTTVEIEIAGHVFSALGRTIVNRGYLDVYRYEAWSRPTIPNYTVGYEFNPSLTLSTGLTSPPPFLSESDLLDCIDKACIGTDVMVHDHIKKLIDSGYAIKEGSHLKPTELGVALVTGYANMGIELWKPHLRRVMEEDMKAVSLGYKKKDDVLKTCLKQMKDCFLDVRKNKGKLFQAFDTFFGRKHHAQFVRKCDVCHDSDMVIRQTKKGRFLIGCSAHPQCDNAIWLDESVSAAVVTDTVCDTCTSGPIYKIKFTFHPVDMPEDSGDTYIGYVGGCDDARSHVSVFCSARGTGITAPSRYYSQNNQQQQKQATCSTCHKEGHSSSDCYSLTSQNCVARYQRGNSNNGGKIAFPLHWGCSSSGTTTCRRGGAAKVIINL